MTLEPKSRTATPSATDLAWLAGFVDGEGSIHAWIERDRPRIKKGLEVTNTVEANVSRARLLIRQLTSRDHRTVVHNVKRGYRPCFTLQVRRADDIDKVIRAISPWLVGKREHADLMLRLLVIVPRSLAAGRGNLRVRSPETGRLRYCYTPEAFEIVRRLMELNRRFAPGEWSARPDVGQAAGAISSSERPRVSSLSSATAPAVMSKRAMNRANTHDWL